MTKEEKIKTLKELLELVQENYFAPFFQDRVNDYDKMPAYELKGIVQEFLECRIIELENEEEY